MGILNSMFAKWKNPPQGAGNDPNVQTIQTSSSVQPPAAPQPSSAMQRYTELEVEMTRSHQTLQTKPINQPEQSGEFKKFGQRLIWIGVLVGIPVGIIYVVNLPYPAIRQPVSKVAPLLLLPSNMAIDANFKKGQATIEEARQLIESPTSPADLDRGELKLKDGRSALDAIPAWYIADWTDYSRGYWGYDGRFTPASLQAARIKAGQLEAKVFQEKNAQIALSDAEKNIVMAKAQFQEAKSAIEKKSAAQNWQNAIDLLNQIPPQTMAGNKAKQFVSNANRDLQAVAGLAISNEKVVSLIGGAEEFAKKAAESGRNPPHSSDRWMEIAKMWQEAINRLEKVSVADSKGYTEVQKKLAEYQTNLSEVKVRLKNEQDSVQALDRANQQLTALWASLPKEGKDLNRNQAMGRFLAIRAELDKVKSGTTVYSQSQEIKVQVQNQLKLLEQAK